MEVFSFSDLFLNPWTVLSSHIQNLRSIVIVDFTEWETVPKSFVAWELRGLELAS
jgi:glutaredoxin-related protein